MPKSDLIVMRFAALAMTVVAVTAFLVYGLWSWETPPDTMARNLRPIILAITLLGGVGTALNVFMNPLVWRVIQRERFREQQSTGEHAS